MSDQEQLAIPQKHPLATTGSSAVSANTALTSTTSTPPYAPRPKPPKGTIVERGNVAELPVLTTSEECSIHEFCYYFQQVLFIAAILTGSALVVAGTVMHIQNGEWLVFVYIGVLLAGVNMVLLLIQCYIRKQQKRRTRNHHAAARQRGSAMQYNLLATSNQGATIVTPPVERHKVKHGHLNLASTIQPSFKDFAAASSQSHAVHSPTESQKRAMLLMTNPQRSGSVVSHYRQTKDIHPRSPSLVQRSVHRPIDSSGSIPFPITRYDISPQSSHLPPVPPPSYDDLICIGHFPQDGTSVHLI